MVIMQSILISSAAALKAHAATPHYLQYGPVLGKSAAVTVTKLVPI